MGMVEVSKKEAVSCVRSLLYTLHKFYIIASIQILSFSTYFTCA